jgi:hypothetical protein
MQPHSQARDLIQSPVGGDSWLRLHEDTAESGNLEARPTNSVNVLHSCSAAATQIIIPMGKVLPLTQRATAELNAICSLAAKPTLLRRCYRSTFNPFTNKLLFTQETSSSQNGTGKVIQALHHVQLRVG